MDNGIWATWYDLPADGRDAHLEWLHTAYLPALTARPGIAWAAHYEITGGGKDMKTLGDRLARPDDDVPTGSGFLTLVGAPSPHAFFQADALWRPENMDAETAGHLGQRQGVRSAVFTEEARVTGPAVDQGVPGGVPAPAIQMGSFRIQTPEDEFALGSWYAQYRLPAMARMPGVIATRKLAGIAGWAKHAILYEFTSLDARLEHFEKPHEALALDDKEWTGRIVKLTIHAPGSPSVAQRIWPQV